MILETERLILRPINVKHASFYFKLFNDKDWIAFVSDKNLKSIEETYKYIEQIFIPEFCKNGLGFFTVFEKENNTAIGASTILKRSFSDDLDIGYGFLPQARGKGFAKEATLRILKYAKQDLNQQKVMAYTKPNNVDSQKLLRKLNFDYLGLKPLFTEVEDAVFELYL